MRILITGAAGNLGGKLRHHLEGRYELVLLSRHSRGDEKIQEADLSLWQASWVRSFEKVDALVHLAANPDPNAPWRNLVKPNIDMLLNVYEAAVEHGVKRLVFASSNHVMSGYRGGAIPSLRSDTPPHPGNPYGATKLFGERIGKSFSERHGISSINVRIGWNQRGSKNIPTPSMGDWGRWMWLSDRDYCQLMECCIKAPEAPRWIIINGISNNAGSPWDLSEARRQVGYQPRDDAFDPQWKD